jgi:hypothetical protein
MEHTLTSVKLANALVQNLSTFDGGGYDRMGSCAERFLTVLAEDADMTPLMAEYHEDVRGLIESLDWILPESFEKATNLATLTAQWVRGIDREAQTEALIRFHR